MATNNRNGRIEPEVVINFADGWSYSKQRMEDAFRSGLFDKPPAKAAKESHNCKKEDVEFIVNELEVPRIQAERALAATNGDVTKALQTLISP